MSLIFKKINFNNENSEYIKSSLRITSNLTRIKLIIKKRNYEIIKDLYIK